ncbi:hypothetical protein CEP53_002373 [Fusarium sp. AF-6]|nr:hypothetical protein CEP53_002373 [Fusarium sp. AF-6]
MVSQGPEAVLRGVALRCKSKAKREPSFNLGVNVQFEIANEHDPDNSKSQPGCANGLGDTLPLNCTKIVPRILQLVTIFWLSYPIKGGASTLIKNTFPHIIASYPNANKLTIFVIGYPDFNYNKEHISNTS